MEEMEGGRSDIADLPQILVWGPTEGRLGPYKKTTLAVRFSPISKRHVSILKAHFRIAGELHVKKVPNENIRQLLVIVAAVKVCICGNAGKSPDILHDEQFLSALTLL